MGLHRNLGLAFSILSVAATAATARPWIEVDTSGHIPADLAPGGVIEASAVVHPDGTSPELLRIWVMSPSGETVYSWESTTEMSHDMTWGIPTDAEWGVYRYRAEYYRTGAVLSAERAIGYLVAAGGLCVFKIHDEDGDGVYDKGDEELLPGWEMCGTGPEDLECKLTDADGVACWFFIDPGVYEVCETLMDGWESTTGECISVDLIEGDVAKVFIGNRVIGTPTIESSWGSIKALYDH